MRGLMVWSTTAHSPIPRSCPSLQSKLQKGIATLSNATRVMSDSNRHGSVWVSSDPEPGNNQELFHEHGRLLFAKGRSEFLYSNKNSCQVFRSLSHVPFSASWSSDTDTSDMHGQKTCTLHPFCMLSLVSSSLEALFYFCVPAVPSSCWNLHVTPWCYNWQTSMLVIVEIPEYLRSSNAPTPKPNNSPALSASSSECMLPT